MDENMKKEDVTRFHLDKWIRIVIKTLFACLRPIVSINPVTEDAKVTRIETMILNHHLSKIDDDHYWQKMDIYVIANHMITLDVPIAVIINPGMDFFSLYNHVNHILLGRFFMNPAQDHDVLWYALRIPFSQCSIDNLANILRQMEEDVTFLYDKIQELELEKKGILKLLRWENVKLDETLKTIAMNYSTLQVRKLWQIFEKNITKATFEISDEDDGSNSESQTIDVDDVQSILEGTEPHDHAEHPRLEMDSQDKETILACSSKKDEHLYV